MSYEPSYQQWCRLGFLPTTGRVRKRKRPDGLLDVLYRETNDYYSAWVAEARTIWLVVRALTTIEPLVDADDLANLINQFPSDTLQSPFSADDPPRLSPDPHLLDAHAAADGSQHSSAIAA